MARRPLLTVALAVYQAQDTVEAALLSVVSQGFSDLEILVVDDASTDNSMAIVGALDTGDIPVRVVTHKKNQGLGPARNSAIAKAKGDYLVFLDADDELLPGSLAEIAEVAVSGDSDVILIGCVELRRGKSRSMHAGLILSEVAGSGVPWTVEEHPELLMWPTSTWSKVMRTEYLRGIGVAFPPGYHQDIPSTVDVMLGSPRVRGVDYPCYFYIRRGEGTSATRSKGTKTLVRIEQITRVRDHHDIAGVDPRVRAHLVALMLVHLIWGNRAAYRTIPDELHEEYFHTCATEARRWWAWATPGPEISSEPLMPTRERVRFAKALLSDSWSTWQRTLARHQRRLTWRRRVDPSRYRLFRKR